MADDDAEYRRKLLDEMAKDAWKSRDQAVSDSLAHTIQFGVNALRAPAVVNAAAIAALLGFVAANSRLLKGQLDGISSALLWLSLGLLVSALASGGAYLTQYLYTTSLGKFVKSWEHPYVIAKAHWSSIAAVVFHCATVLLVVLGYICFIVGLIYFFPVVKAVIIAGSAAATTP